MRIKQRVFGCLKIQIIRDKNLSWAAKGFLAYVQCC